MARSKKFEERKRMEEDFAETSPFFDLDVEEDQDEEDIHDVRRHAIHFWAMILVPEFPLQPDYSISVRKYGTFRATSDCRIISDDNGAEFSSLSGVAEHYLPKYTKNESRSKTGKSKKATPNGWEVCFVGSEFSEQRITLDHLFLSQWRDLGMDVQTLKSSDAVFATIKSRKLIQSKEAEERLEKAVRSYTTNW